MSQLPCASRGSDRFCDDADCRACLHLVWQCDRCGRVLDEDKDEEEVSQVYERFFAWKYDVFKCRNTYLPDADFCLACWDTLTPVFWDLRDVAELCYMVNKLKRAIYERKKATKQHSYNR